MSPATFRKLRRFVTPEVFYLELAAVSWFLFVPYLMTAHGHLDFARHAVGRDFVNAWTAAHLEFTPHRLDIFQPAKFLAWERRLFDPKLPFHFWSYPPPALLLTAPLALFGYHQGLILWSLAGLAALVPAARTYFGPGVFPGMMFVFAPAAAVNIALGQNGAVTGALLVSGLALLDRRPLLAGALLGLLVFKPQLALLLPFAMLATGRWRVIAAAAASALAVLALSTAVFGADAWRGFFGPTLLMQSIMLSRGHGPFMWMMTSPYMTVRALHGAVPLALALQLPFTLAAVVLATLVYRSARSLELKAALLILLTFLASPQGFNYDLVAASASALYLMRQPSVFRWLSGLLLWALPVLLIAAQALKAPFGPPILAAATLALLTVREPPEAPAAAGVQARAASARFRTSRASDRGSKT